MTPRENYAKFVDNIFGGGAAKFDIAKTGTNEVIGALASKQNFSEFKANFEERLRRINASIQSDPNLGIAVIDAVNRIAGYEWDGAYAELCALDYFLAAPLTGSGNIELDQTVPGSTTLATEMGMQNSNYDMRLKNLGVSMDTKNLSDKTGQILDGILNEFRQAKGIMSMMIVPTYDLDDDFNPYAEKRQQLLSELIRDVNVSHKTPRLESQVIPGLSYEFAWNAGVYISESTYSPVEHATKHHTLLFGHIKKFSRIEPTVIVYVMFPWSGESAFFGFGKDTFQTEFGKQFFNNYLGSTSLAKSINKKVRSDITCAEVTKHLSGVIFLDDKSATAKDSKQINIEASFVWNEHAAQSLVGHPLDEELRRRKAVDRG